MQIPNEPTDILGLAMHRSLLSKMQESKEYEQFIKGLNENIVLSTDYYDLMIIFKDGMFEVTRTIENPTVIIKITIEEFFKIMEKRTSIIASFLKSKMKIKKGLLKLFKIYKLFSKIMN